MSRLERGWRSHVDELRPFLSVALQSAASPVTGSVLDEPRMEAARELFRAYLDDLETAESFVPAEPQNRHWYKAVDGLAPADRLALALLAARFVGRMERYDLADDLPHLKVPIGIFTKFPRVLLGQLLARELAPDGPGWAELLDAAELLNDLFPAGEDLTAALDALGRTFGRAELPPSLAAELAATATRWRASPNELLWPLARHIERLIGESPDAERPTGTQAWAVMLINDVAGERLMRPGPYRGLRSMGAIRERDPAERAHIATVAAVGLRESLRRTEVRAGGEFGVQLCSTYPRACLWVLCELLVRRLPVSDGQLAQLIALAGLSPNYELRVTQRELDRLVRAVVRQIELHARRAALTGRAATAANALEARLRRAGTRDSVVLANRVARASGNVILPLDPDEPWAAAAAGRIRAAGEHAGDWTRLLHHCQAVATAVPGRGWLARAEELIRAVGEDAFREAVSEWFTLAKLPRPAERDPGDALRPIEANALVLRGLAWCCTLCPDERLARALGELAATAYAKVPWIGARAPKVGNACLWALARGAPATGIQQLTTLRHRLRGATPTIRARLHRALRTLAARAELSEAELAELEPPSFDMTEVGRKVIPFGSAHAELRATPRGSVQVAWYSAGAARRGVPALVRREHGDALARLRQCRRDMERALSAERARLEGLFLEARRWPLAAWRRRYLDHPLTGALGRLLIWRFVDGLRSDSGLFHEGRIVNAAGAELDWLTAETAVELWHPVACEVAHVLAWREFLEGHEVRQPFKQAHREVYTLTDAERQTATWSNRFAGHILRQHPFHALCAARGWENRLLLMGVDSGPTPPTRRVPAFGVRAELLVAGVGSDVETDVTEAGVYRHVATDRVSFYALEGTAPVELSGVDPVAFSEIMRDVDLFVGVASVGNDPTWYDGGPGGRFGAYWSSYAFGELGERGRFRAELLERLLPRLPIGGRCHVDGRFLVVRGDVGVYRIHLNSASVLMQPGDRYLCIVPDRSALGALTGRLYLPFEGDEGLAIVLSKALLLANDSRITDPIILRQIRAGG